MRKDNTIPEGYKRCSKGEKCVNPDGPVLPATSEYFGADKYKNSLKNYCRKCDSLYGKQYRQLPENKAKDKARRQTPLFKEQHKEHEKIRRQTPRAKATREKYKQTPKFKANRKAGHQLPSAVAYRKAYPKTSRGRAISCAAFQRRRARVQSLPDTFTDNDLKRSLEYFYGACAYCGNPPSLFDRFAVLHADHFIPLSDPSCPGTVPENMLPACQGCNLSKGDKDPHIWLVERFGKRRANAILKNIKTYFATMKGDQ